MRINTNYRYQGSKSRTDTHIYSFISTTISTATPTLYNRPQIQKCYCIYTLLHLKHTNPHTRQTHTCQVHNRHNARPKMIHNFYTSVRLYSYFYLLSLNAYNQVQKNELRNMLYLHTQIRHIKQNSIIIILFKFFTLIIRYRNLIFYIQIGYINNQLIPQIRMSLTHIVRTVYSLSWPIQKQIYSKSLPSYNHKQLNNAHPPHPHPLIAFSPPFNQRCNKIVKQIYISLRASRKQKKESKKLSKQTSYTHFGFHNANIEISNTNDHSKTQLKLLLISRIYSHRTKEDVYNICVSVDRNYTYVYVYRFIYFPTTNRTYTIRSRRSSFRYRQQCQFLTLLSVCLAIQLMDNFPLSNIYQILLNTKLLIQSRAIINMSLIQIRSILQIPPPPPHFKKDEQQQPQKKGLQIYLVFIFIPSCFYFHLPSYKINNPSQFQTSPHNKKSYGTQVQIYIRDSILLWNVRKATKNLLVLSLLTKYTNRPNRQIMRKTQKSYPGHQHWKRTNK
eukprot:TRINITY_DN41844_c0_g4_i1.p1 TRINITY_DN41844_c0_g4~~TRINITY_DN41844_c0_g4_i1.p1  ORF type:complete len:503 (+),score=-59.21 TRINITY_DN41844_c0_g4_i1:498-2006(+)